MNVLRQCRMIDVTHTSRLSSIFSTLSIRHTSSRHAPVHKVSTRPPASSARHTMLRKNRGLYGSTHIQHGNSISDSHRKTARTFKPNVHTHTFVSPVLANEHITMKTTTRELRTIKKYGGLDVYLMQGGKGVQRDLGTRARALKKRMESAAEKKRARQIEKTSVLKTLRLLKKAGKGSSIETSAASVSRSPSPS